MLKELEIASSDDQADSLLDRIEELGGPDKEHAGMVRSMFEVLLRRDWQEIFGPDEA